MWRYLLGTAMVCLAVGSVICLALPALADGGLLRPGPKDEGDARIEFGGYNAPSQKDPSYLHGCTVVCNNTGGPCGWTRAKSNKLTTNELCQVAQGFFVSDFCSRFGKTPATGCTIYNSWWGGGPPQAQRSRGVLVSPEPSDYRITLLFFGRGAVGHRRHIARGLLMY